MLGNTCSGGRRLLAVDHNIAKLHEHKIRQVLSKLRFCRSLAGLGNVFVSEGLLLLQYFQAHDVPIHFHTIQADEQNKDFDQVFSLAAAMHEFSINR